MLDFEKKVKEFTDQLAETLIAKNKDYGNSVEEQFKEYGDISVLVRLDDKMRRLKTLINSSQPMVKQESRKDTVKDLAMVNWWPRSIRPGLHILVTLEH